MKKTAFDQANERLARAQRASSELAEARDFNTIRSAWSDFLVAAAAIYSKLEQGAKDDGRSNAWYGRVKNVRKNDPLLFYIHHARNTDQHGIEEVVVPNTKGEITFVGSLPWENFTMSYKDVDPENPSRGHALKNLTTGENLRISREHNEFYLRVVAVRNERYNITAAPPKSHNGQEINVDEPAQLAALAIVYLESVLKDAAIYVV